MATNDITVEVDFERITLSVRPVPAGGDGSTWDFTQADNSAQALLIWD